MIEQFHHERKQLTDVPACQCRPKPAQPHRAGHARLDPTKQVAYQTQETVYQLKRGFLDAYVRHELIKPPLALA